MLFAWKKVRRTHRPLPASVPPDARPPVAETSTMLERLVEFDFSIIPIRGKSNQDNQKDSPSTQEYSQNLLKDILEKDFPNECDIEHHTRTYHCPEIGKRIRTGPRVPEDVQRANISLEVEDGILYRDNRLCVPKGEFRT